MTANFVNCTPHDIKFNSGKIFAKSGINARVSASFSDITDFICDQVFGEVQDLPNPVEGTFFIVSEKTVLRQQLVTLKLSETKRVT